MPKIRFKRGLKTNLPVLDEGEPAFTTDTEEFFIGSQAGNIELAKQADLDSTNVQVTSNTDALNNLANVNPNAEILAARGTFPLLGSRLDNIDSEVSTNTSSLAERALQTDLNITNANVSANVTAIAAKADITYVDNKVAGAVNGSPIPVSLSANMTDHTRNYVYTGVEAGYTAGHWYGWNGSSWTDGGVYQATGISDNAVTLDSTQTGDYFWHYISTGLPYKIPASLPNGLYKVTMDNKNAFVVSNGNLADSFKIPSSTVTLNGVTATTTVDGVTLTGTASANTYFRLDGTLQAQASSTGLGSKNYTVPVDGNYRIVIYPSSSSVTGSVSMGIRTSDGSANISTIYLTNGVTGAVKSPDFTLTQSGSGALYFFVPSGSVLNYSAKIALVPTINSSFQTYTAPSNSTITAKNYVLNTTGSYVLSASTGSIYQLVKVNQLINYKKILVDRELDTLYFYIQGDSKDKWLKYKFMHSISTQKNADSWRLDQVYAVQYNNGIFTNLFEVIQDTAEWEMALRLNNETNFIGGIAHGGEVMTSMRFYKDGKSFEGTDQISLANLKSSTLTYNGLTITTTTNGFTISGTASANSYIRLDGGLLGATSNTGLGSKTFTLPVDGYRMEITNSNNTITTGGITLSVRTADNTGNQMSVNLASGKTNIICPEFAYSESGTGGIYLYVNSGSVVNYASTLKLVPIHMGFQYVDKLSFVEQSNLYDTNGTPNNVATHLKRYDITSDYIELYQEINWLLSCNMTTSYVTMLGINRGNDARVSTQVTDIVFDNGDFNEYDVSIGGFTTYPNVQKTGITKYNIYGKTSGVSAEVEILQQEPFNPASLSFVQNTVDQYNKIYFDFCGTNYTTQVGDKWKIKSRFSLKISD